MKYRIAFSLVMIGIFIACATKTLPPVVFQIPTRHIDYMTEVKPLLDKRCAVCHSCYNSPCQLKLDSFEGADRGATKRAVYNGSRLRSMDPTRLFTDAQSTGEWRQKEFFSVTDSKVSGELNDSIMIEILSHKIKNPKSVGEYRSEANDLTCSENTDELAGYLEKHPNNGMPFGFPALKPEEFAIIAGWLVQGAKGPDATRQKVLITPKASDAYAIKQWETFLNLD
ncbi:MAG: fatty acid cis/trans isomerase, partial [Smithella sp.]